MSDQHYESISPKSQSESQKGYAEFRTDDYEQMDQVGSAKKKTSSLPPSQPTQISGPSLQPTQQTRTNSMSSEQRRFSATNEPYPSILRSRRKRFLPNVVIFIDQLTDY